jgi:hypothetical protein
MAVYFELCSGAFSAAQVTGCRVEKTKFNRSRVRLSNNARGVTIKFPEFPQKCRIE